MKRGTLEFITIIPEVPTSRGHIYSADVLNAIYADAQKRVPRFGCLEHPADGKTRLAEVAFTLTAVEWNPDTLAGKGHIEFVPTPQGKMAASLYVSGASMLLAPRLIGCTDASGRIDGKSVRLVSIDIVLPDKSGAERSPLDLIVREIFSERGLAEDYLVHP